jgi:hypothetical protein
LGVSARIALPKRVKKRVEKLRVKKKIEKNFLDINQLN